MNLPDSHTYLLMTCWQWFFFISGIIAWIAPFVLIGLLMWTDRNIAKEKEAQLRKEEAFQKSQAFKDTKEIYDELHKKDFK